MFVCERPGSDAIPTSPSSRRGPYGRSDERSLPPSPTTTATTAVFLIAGGSSEAVLGPRADHATPGPSALVLRHACVGVTGGRVPRHRRKVVAAPGPGWGYSSGTCGKTSRERTDGQTDCRSGLIEPSADRGQTAGRRPSRSGWRNGWAETVPSARTITTAFARSLSISRLASAHAKATRRTGNLGKTGTWESVYYNYECRIPLRQRPLNYRVSAPLRCNV